jgi:hypothetical protein
MSPWLILVVMVIYSVIAIDLWRGGNPAMAVVFAGYAFSNIGLWAASR